MSKSDVIKVYTTRHTHEVNEHLSNGWVLLDTSSGRFEEGNAYFLYALGWTKEAETNQKLLSSAI